MKLIKGKDVYTDGSAKHVGTPWATGASAVVQYDEQGREQGWAIVLPKGFPLSAVATEHMALLLCRLMAYKAQVGRCILEPQWEVGEETTLSDEQRERRRAEWQGQITVHADCMAVIHATRRPGASLRDQSKYGGCYKHEGFDALGQVWRVIQARRIRRTGASRQVDAHRGKDQATAEGWERHWEGNDAADQIAKAVRPKLVGNEKQQHVAVSNVQAKRRRVDSLCKNLGDMWECVFQLKKT